MAERESATWRPDRGWSKIHWAEDNQDLTFHCCAFDAKPNTPAQLEASLAVLCTAIHSKQHKGGKEEKPEEDKEEEKDQQRAGDFICSVVLGVFN